MTTLCQEQQCINNASAFAQLLGQLEAASAGIVRDSGTRFETLVRDWLSKDPAYRDLFSKVQTYKDWAEEHPELVPNKRDIGIDLVGTNADDDSYTAIQCKFYPVKSTVSKSEVDSFIAASNKKCFTRRFLVATNERWTGNVQTELAQCQPPITLITRSTMADSSVNWSAYLKGDSLELQPKRTPRPYQEDAIENVLRGFQTQNRGKLIMACGTGKTFTSMKIAEKMEGQGGLVMFLVPSLALLSQTLTDWKRQCSVPLHAFAVCSDSTTGKADLNDIDELTSTSDLCYPATTQADKLAKEIVKAHEKKGMTVIFSTYQSIEVVSEAQKKYGLGEIGLVICDEAHRTAGGHYSDEEDAAFQRIHSDDFIRAGKRLYMTATPRIYGDAVKEQKDKGDVVLYSMDDEEVFGPTFHTITFSQAVSLGSLVDYKVIVLTVEEDILKSRAFSDFEVVQAGGLPIKHAAKVIGCWRALSKLDINQNASISDDMQPMRRAVGFAQIISPNLKYLDRTSSKLFSQNFSETIEEFKDENFAQLAQNDPDLSREAYDLMYPLKCETKHIDGTMNSNEKDALLNWLRETPADDVCKILFNVRCLSEGVDVPSLDAVLFLSPRKSQVEVVQTVGRVMRVSPQTGKKRGYVIIPIVTPAGVPADMALNNNKDFDVVWQVLNALKSIDTEFGAIVDGQRNIIDSHKIEVVCISNKLNRRSKKTQTSGTKLKKRLDQISGKVGDQSTQTQLDFGHDEILEQEIRARIVKRVGNRREWGDWAEDVGQICQGQIKHIKDVLADPKNETARKAFTSFQEELKATLNGNLSNDDVIEMLGQHVVTQPILDALFTVKNGDEVIYEFSKQNPIAKAMTTMMEALDKEGMKVANKSLEEFYRSVRMRTRMIKTAVDRQVLIKELFEKFFKVAFPKMQEKLGIVYTPVEIVDFINQSVADLLEKEFKTDISEDGIHILDPFAGTGTFIARLMQSGLIPKEKLPQKFENDLHACEIVPLAYYIASMNLEGVFHELCPDEAYKFNNVMIWTDTFANNGQNDIFKTTLGENNERLAALNLQDIRVIIGNPPYSVGGDSRDSDNPNDDYPELFKRIEESYTKRSNKKGGKKASRDSYKLAFRWASDRIGKKGIIAFVANASWLESVSDDGMRKCVVEEFNSIYIYHLKGNQRTSGERSRQEGGKVFDEGSRAPIAIVFLVKNPESEKHGEIHFHAVDDYQTKEEKFNSLKCEFSIVRTKTRVIVPDHHGDWLNFRDDGFSKFISIAQEKTELGMFVDYSTGVVTGKDCWVFNSSTRSLIDNVSRMIRFFNKEVERFKLECPKLRDDKELQSWVKKDLSQISWGGNGWRSPLKRGKLQAFDDSLIRSSMYRPFFIQKYYASKVFSHSLYSQPKIFPTAETKNLVICCSGVGSREFSCLMCDEIPCLDLLEKTQSFPRWLPKKSEISDGELNLWTVDINRDSGFTPVALPHFQAAYPGKELDEDALFYYIYGLLHSEEYRSRYANNLMKELPRIPRVATYEQFMAFSDAGRRLAELHVHFEDVKPYQDVRIEYTKVGNPSYRVKQMEWGKILGKKGNAAKDKTTLIYNDWITVHNIPLKAQEYVVNKKSALDWVVEYAAVKLDKKGKSGIINDFNDYADEIGNPRYPLDLFLKIITVSLETMKIVKSLPALEIHRLDLAPKNEVEK